MRGWLWPQRALVAMTTSTAVPRRNGELFYLNLPLDGKRPGNTGPGAESGERMLLNEADTRAKLIDPCYS